MSRALHSKKTILFFLLFWFAIPRSIAQYTIVTEKNQSYLYDSSDVIVAPQLILSTDDSNTPSISNGRIKITSGYVKGDSLLFDSQKIPSTLNVSMANGAIVVSGTAKPSEWVAFFRSVVFRNSKSNTTTQRSVTFMVGDVTVSNNGHFYQFVPSPTSAQDDFISWYDADKAASSLKFNGMQGYLATILSSEENELLTNELKGNGWLGGSDDYKQINAAIGSTKYNNQSESEGQWFWVRGPEKGISFYKATYNGDPNGQVAGKYANWNQNEPNNNWAQKTETDTTKPENFLEIYGAGGAYGSKGTWNDWNALKHYSGQDFIKGFVVEFGGMDGDPTTNIFAEGTVNITKSFITPVKLNSFYGIVKNKSVVLSWSTLSEINSKSFNVLRSVDGGKSWDNLESISAKGNSNNLSQYNYTDQYPKKQNLYKLNQIDKDGTHEFSNIISVDLPEGVAEEISLFPNPTTENVTIKNVEIGSTIGIYNIAGVLLKSLTANNKMITIQLNTLPSGVYVMRIVSNKNAVHSLKFIKSR